MNKQKTYHIAVIPGDGTGPEVTREALKVLAAVSAKHGFKRAIVPKANAPKTKIAGLEVVAVERLEQALSHIKGG